MALNGRTTASLSPVNTARILANLRPEDTLDLLVECDVAHSLVPKPGQVFDANVTNDGLILGLDMRSKGTGIFLLFELVCNYVTPKGFTLVQNS